MAGVRDYSTTAASNLSVGGISIAEGWARASVNNAYREGMADIANLLLDTGGETLTTGSSNAYLLNLPSAPSSYADNMAFICRLNHTATGAATMNINGLGAKDFKKMQAGVPTALSSGDARSGDRAICVYSSSANAVLMLNTQAVFTQAGGGITWPIVDRMKQTVYLLDFIPQSEHAAILAGTSTYDCSDAMDDAMACLTVPSDNTAFYEGGAEIIFPYGTCYFSRTIELKKTLTLTGHGIGGRNGWASRLLFAANITGITVNSLTGFEGDMDPPVYPIPGTPHSKGGDASTIRGLKISSQSVGVRNPALNETGNGVGHGIGHGIWCRSRANIQQCIIQYFPQHGLYVRAAAVITDTPDNRAVYGNANNMYVAQVACLSNAGCGCYIDGPDTNAGVFIGMDFGSNKLSGLRESSLIGNTHIGPHTDNNGTDALCSYAVTPGVTQMARYYCRDVALAPTIPPTGHVQSEDAWGFIQNTGGPVGTIDTHTSYPHWPFLLDGVTAKDYRLGYTYWCDQVSAPNVLVQPYTEGGQPHSLISSPTIVIGTLNYDADTTCSKFQGGSGYALIAPAVMVESKNDALNTREFRAYIGRVSGEALTFQVDGDPSTPVALASSFGYVWDEATGTWMLQHARNAARIAQRFTTTLNNITGGRTNPIAAGNTIFQQGMWLGRHPTYIRHLTMTEALPTTGQWAAGDYAFNATPGGTGAVLGWRCVTSGDFAGTPPVFQAVRPSTSQQTIVASAVNPAFTLTPSTSPYHTLYTGTMTATRPVTLSTTLATIGMTYRITRTAGGAFDLTVGTGPLKTLAPNTWCDVTFDGTAYYLSAYGAL